MDAVLLFIYVGFSLGVAYLAFCRLHQSSIEVRWEVRWSWSLVGSAAVAMALSPFVGWAPANPPATMFMGACFAAFLASSQAWKKGVPQGLTFKTAANRK